MNTGRERPSSLVMRWGLIALVVLAAPLHARADAPCTGDYAEDLSALSPHGREIEVRSAPYSYAVRATSTYECVSYGADSNLRTSRSTAAAYGTAFGYRRDDADTLLITNDHVAEWPAVTDAEHMVDGIPSGCKRVAESLKIVDGDHDDYAPDDIALTRVVADPMLDIAILRAHAKLEVIPWRVGHSAALASRVAVEVKGFPLGEFRATNVGKVIAAYNHDEQGDWNHDDFVVDALLSPGNSGSPVLAISCKTGELELVGVYHAGYSRGSALNVVVGIEQIRDLMTTLKRSPRRDAPPPSDAASRAALVELLRRPLGPSFPFGSSVASVQLRSDGALIYQVLNRDFPFRSFPILAVEDLPPAAPDDFGTLGAVWFGGPAGLKAYGRSELDAEAQGIIARALDALRRDGQAAFQYQAADMVSRPTRAQFDVRTRLERTLRKAAASRSDLGQQIADLADRLAPQAGDAGVSLADAFSVRPAAPPPDAPQALPATAATTAAATVPPATLAAPR